MIQTRQVIERLQRQWPNLRITIEQIHTVGDRVKDAPLTKIGGDGVFVTEIERALYEKRIDLAVHSLKDLPTTQPQGVRLIVPGPREDVRDVFVSNGHLRPFLAEQFAGEQTKEIHFQQELRIGTGSLRRIAQIRARFPGAQLLPIRGNVDTRLRKLEAHEYDGIVLAAAGLHRMDMMERLAGRTFYLPIEIVMPAPGQGALVVEIRDEPEMLELLSPLNDAITQATTSAERTFMRRLGAGCFLPVAAYGEVAGETLTLRGLVISLDGQRQVRAQQSIGWTTEDTLEDAELLGIKVAEQALEQGAHDIIDSLLSTSEQEHLHV
jgi:hydroxymethylbilane synthase